MLPLTAIEIILSYLPAYIRLEIPHGNRYRVKLALETPFEFRRKRGILVRLGPNLRSMHPTKSDLVCIPYPPKWWNRNYDYPVKLASLRKYLSYFCGNKMPKHILSRRTAGGFLLHFEITP